MVRPEESAQVCHGDGNSWDIGGGAAGGGVAGTFAATAAGGFGGFALAAEFVQVSASEPSKVSERAVRRIIILR